MALTSEWHKYWEQLSHFQLFSNVFGPVYNTFERSAFMGIQWQGENECFQRPEGPKVTAQALSVRQALLCLPYRSSIYGEIPRYQQLTDMLGSRLLVSGLGFSCDW